MKKNAFIFFVLIVLNARAQKQWNVLDWKTEYTLNTYLLEKMHTQYDERDKEFKKALGSEKNMRAYIESARKRFLTLLSPLAVRRVNIPAITTGIIEEDNYKIEKIIYESFPSHHVTANLYVPKGSGPFPAVLLFCGHEDISKATESYQQTAILFAKNGYVVMVIDPISQSERYQVTDASGKPLTRGGTSEHTFLNSASNLLGLSTPQDELLDNKAGLDYLVTRAEVDTARIGCLGNSGGGMQTIYFAAYEPRIKVAVPCSYFTTRRRTLELTGPADGCAQMPGEGTARLEFADYLLMAAPRPVLILAGRYDFIDYRGTEEGFSEMKKAYTVLGHSGKVELFSYDDGHGISKPKREAAVSWFNRWLKNNRPPVPEREVSIKTPAQLAATATGQINASYPDEVTITKRNQLVFESLQNSRAAARQKPGELRNSIEKMAAINPDRNIAIEESGTIQLKGTIFFKKIIRKKNEPPLPILVAYPSTCSKIWIGCDEKGKANSMASDSVPLLLSKGYAVVLCDLRGTGETEDKAELNDPKYFNREYRNAMLSLHTGRSLVSQRTTDIFSVLDMIQKDHVLKTKPVEIKASGIATLPLLLAALLDKRIQKIYLSNGIRSYRSVFENPTTRDWYSYVVPRMATLLDIPDMEALIGKERIQWLN